jgi:PAS domain S-box-containing protein
MSTPDLDKLVAVVDELDPHTLTEKDIADIKAWGADQVGFVLVDVDSQKIVYATPGAEKIFGYVTDEMVNLDLITLVPEDFRHSHVQHVEGFGKAMQTRSMGRRDTILYGRERDGKTFPVEIGLFPRQFRKRKLVLANVVRLSKEI